MMIVFQKKKKKKNYFTTKEPKLCVIGEDKSNFFATTVNLV